MDTFQEEMRISITVVCSVLMIFGILGNIIIILTIIKNKKLRVMMNVFVASLAFIDLLIISCLLPFNLYTVLTNGEYVSKTLCKINGIMVHVLFTSSLQYVMVISISRYVKICHPQNFISVFSPGNTVFIYVYCMLLNLAFVLPLVFDFEENVIFDRSLHMCIFSRYESKMYSWVFITSCLFIPVGVTIVCYMRTYHIVIKSRRRIHLNYVHTVNRNSDKLASIRFQFCVLIAYLLLYIPFGLTCLLNKETLPDIFHTISVYLVYACSTMNALLYGLFNGNIRSVYFKLFKRLKRRHGQVLPIPRQASNSIFVNVLPIPGRTMDEIRLEI